MPRCSRSSGKQALDRDPAGLADQVADHQHAARATRPGRVAVGRVAEAGASARRPVRSLTHVRIVAGRRRVDPRSAAPLHPCTAQGADDFRFRTVGRTVDLTRGNASEGATLAPRTGRSRRPMGTRRGDRAALGAEGGSVKRPLTRILPILTSAILVLAFGGPAAASAPVVLASPGPSPFLGCTADDAAAQIAAGSVLYPNSRDRAAVDDQPHERDEHRRRVPAGPLERRRCARPRRERQPRRRGDLEPGRRPQGDQVLGRRLRPRVRPVGLVRAERRPVRDLAQLRRVRSAQRHPRVEVDRRRRHLGRSDRGDRRRHERARQGVDHGRPARLEPRVRDLGPAAHARREHARLGPGRHPFAVVQVADLLRPLDRRRADLGAAATAIHRYVVLGLDRRDDPRARRRDAARRPADLRQCRLEGRRLRQRVRPALDRSRA